jgi:hypothetical protein
MNPTSLTLQGVWGGRLRCILAILLFLLYGNLHAEDGRGLGVPVVEATAALDFNQRKLVVSITNLSSYKINILPELQDSPPVPPSIPPDYEHLTCVGVSIRFAKRKPHIDYTKEDMDSTFPSSGMVPPTFEIAPGKKRIIEFALSHIFITLKNNSGEISVILAYNKTAIRTISFKKIGDVWKPNLD